MTEADIRAVAIAALSAIAPETDPASLAGDADIREELDLDSMDFLNFVIALHRQSGETIPEADYPRLQTLDGVVTYLEARRAHVRNP